MLMQFGRTLKLIILFAVCQLSIGCSSAPFSQRFAGGNLQNVELKTFTAHGGLDLNAVTITKQIDVNGGLNASNAKLANVSVNGRSVIENSVISGSMHLNGSSYLNQTVLNGELSQNGRLMADSSTFSQDIFVNAEMIELYNTKVKKQIVVRKGFNPQIRLAEGTVVHGDIVFEDGHGTIIMDDSSKVMGSIRSVEKDDKRVKVRVGS